MTRAGCGGVCETSPYGASNRLTIASAAAGADCRDSTEQVKKDLARFGKTQTIVTSRLCESRIVVSEVAYPQLKCRMGHTERKTLCQKRHMPARNAAHDTQSTECCAKSIVLATRNGAFSTQNACATGTGALTRVPRGRGHWHTLGTQSWAEHRTLCRRRRFGGRKRRPWHTEPHVPRGRGHWHTLAAQN